MNAGDIMELSRIKQREMIMVALYQIFLHRKNKINYDQNKILEDLNIEDISFVTSVINGVIEKRIRIDEIANKYLKNWDISRLGQTDQAILRMAIYEMLYTDTPKVAIINEAVELAKKYSDEKVKGMINGVLDQILKNE